MITTSHVPACSAPAGSQLLRACGNACGTAAVVFVLNQAARISQSRLAEDRMPPGRELGPVVDELLAERNEDHVLLGHLLVDVGQGVRAAS